jgi:lipoate---protein ligase
MSISAYRLEGFSPLDHLAVENVLLETYDGASPILLFYINDPSVIIGRNQNPWREVPASSKLPLFRRGSGGGAVYHDRGNVNWAFIVPRVLHSQEKELAAMAAAISARGFELRPGPRGGLYCGGSSVHAGGKVSGTARRFGAKNVLHHGTLLVSSDMACLRASLGGIETCDDNSVPSVPAIPLNLTEIRPDLRTDELIDGISAYFSGGPAQPFLSTRIDPGLIGKEKAKLASREWIYRSTPPFSLCLKAAGSVFSLRVEKGNIVDATAPDLIGLPFSYSIMTD